MFYWENLHLWNPPLSPAKSTKEELKGVGKSWKVSSLRCYPCFQTPQILIWQQLWVTSPVLKVPTTPQPRGSLPRCSLSMCWVDRALLPPQGSREELTFRIMSLYEFIEKAQLLYWPPIFSISEYQLFLPLKSGFAETPDMKALICLVSQVSCKRP